MIVSILLQLNLGGSFQNYQDQFEALKKFKLFDEEVILQ